MRFMETYISEMIQDLIGYKKIEKEDDKADPLEVSN